MTNNDEVLAISCLCEALLTDLDSITRCEIADALGEWGNKDAIPTLSVVLLNDKDVDVRRRAAKALGKIGNNQKMTGDRIINTGGGSYYESIDTSGGNYIQGDYINMSQDLTEAASQIQDLIDRLQQQGMTVEVAQAQVVQDIATQAQNDPTMKKQLIKWSKSLGSATITDVVKGIVKLAIRSAGIPLP